MSERYYTKYAAAAIRGALLRRGLEDSVDRATLERELDMLSEAECERLFSVAADNGIKLYHFKRSDRTLPRVNKTIGFLRGISFESLLDVGSGRGVFLLPFLEEFPWVEVCSVDILDKRIELLGDIVRGGVPRLRVLQANVCDQPLPDRSVDVVTLLEVLEHIPDVEGAVRAAVRMARKYIVVTVPSKEDNNPEHIHLLTKARLTELFGACGVTRLSFDGVPGHLFMIARIGDDKIGL